MGWLVLYRFYLTDSHKPIQTHPNRAKHTQTRSNVHKHIPMHKSAPTCPKLHKHSHTAKCIEPCHKVHEITKITQTTKCSKHQNMSKPAQTFTTPQNFPKSAKPAKIRPRMLKCTQTCSNTPKARTNIHNPAQTLLIRQNTHKPTQMC